MQLDLTDAEHQALRQVIEEVLGDLSMELADTDSPDFRRDLDTRRANLQAVRDKLAE